MDQNNPAPVYSLQELFTDEELAACTQIYRETGGGLGFVERCVREVVEPALPRINELTGQPNDPAYFAYTLDYAITIANAKSRMNDVRSSEDS